MTTFLKKKVSKNRKRHFEFGLDLDLTYITERIIAMAFPAERMESFYRNDLNDVSELLERKHKDHYFIYNLCSERSYDKSKFEHRVKVYPFEDHNPPGFPVIKAFCDDVHNCLNSDERNVVAIHCKAGKGRTGTMICCYLLHCGMFETADAAIEFYGKQRTEDGRGVTIPSQIRYIKYYERYLREGKRYHPTPINIKRVHMRPVPKFSEPILYIAKERIYFDTPRDFGTLRTVASKISRGEDIKYEGNFSIMEPGVKTRDIHFDADDAEIEIDFPNARSSSGDIRIELFYRSPVFTKKKRLARVWINTYFADKDGLTCTVGPNYRDLIFKKNDLDIAWKKDKKHRQLPADFELKIHLEIPPKRPVPREAASADSKMPSSSIPSCSGEVASGRTLELDANNEKRPSHADHESSGAEEDSEDENDCDSGKFITEKTNGVTVREDENGMELHPIDGHSKLTAVERLKLQDKVDSSSSEASSSTYNTVKSAIHRDVPSSSSFASTNIDLPSSSQTDGQSGPSGSSGADGYSTAAAAGARNWTSAPQHGFPCRTDEDHLLTVIKRKRRVFWVVPVPSMCRCRNTTTLDG